MTIASLRTPISLTTGPQTLAVTVTLTSGRDIADWDYFVCTVREDPGWSDTGGRRAGSDLALPEDPVEDGWAVAQEVQTTDTEGTDTILFTLPGGLTPGVTRYALDVWGVGGAAGEVQLLEATWTTVKNTSRGLGDPLPPDTIEPLGPSGSVLYNSGGTVAGEAAFSYDEVTNTLTIIAGRVSASGAGANSEQFGSGAMASAIGSTAIGQGAISSGLNSAAVGQGSSATGSSSYACGVATVASTTNTIAVGTQAAATGINAIAIGKSATASITYSIAIGESASATHQGGIALGQSATTTAAYQLVIGSTPSPVNEIVTASAHPTFRLDGADKSFRVKGYTAQTADLQQWQDSTGSEMLAVRADGRLASHGYINTATIAVMTYASGYPAIIVRAQAGQTQDLMDFRSNAGAVLCAIAKNGAFKPASLADADAENGTVYYSLTQSKLAFKDPAGTVNTLY